MRSTCAELVYSFPPLMTFGGLLELLGLGKRIYDAWVRRGAPFHSDEFMAKNSQFLRYSIDLVPGIDSLGRSDIDSGITALLSHLASIVKAYNKGAGTFVNANYMVPYEPTAEMRDAASFCRKDRDPSSFHCFLRLEKWAVPDGACPSIVLPVERTGTVDPNLFGAPSAFLYNRSEVINDTLDVDLWGYEASHLRIEIDAFFKAQQKRLRSFASFPVVAPAAVKHNCPHPVIAVVNLDSNVRFLIGRHWSNQHKLGLALEPVIHILSHFLVRKHFLDLETAEVKDAS